MSCTSFCHPFVILLLSFCRPFVILWLLLIRLYSKQINIYDPDYISSLLLFRLLWFLSFNNCLNVTRGSHSEDTEPPSPPGRSAIPFKWQWKWWNSNLLCRINDYDVTPNFNCSDCRWVHSQTWPKYVLSQDKLVCDMAIRKQKKNPRNRRKIKSPRIARHRDKGEGDSNNKRKQSHKKFAKFWI